MSNNSGRLRGNFKVASPLAVRFTRYISIGLLNTALHWCVFFMSYYWLALSQAASNLAAFLVAVSFSFFMNARFTFQRQATTARYVLFVGFMAGLSYATGYVADRVSLLPLLTMIIFSAISLVAGFAYANYIVFHKRDRG